MTTSGSWPGGQQDGALTDHELRGHWHARISARCTQGTWRRWVPSWFLSKMPVLASDGRQAARRSIAPRKPSFVHPPRFDSHGAVPSSAKHPAYCGRLPVNIRGTRVPSSVQSVPAKHDSERLALTRNILFQTAVPRPGELGRSPRGAPRQPAQPDNDPLLALQAAPGRRLVSVSGKISLCPFRGLACSPTRFGRLHPSHASRSLLWLQLLSATDTSQPLRVSPAWIMYGSPVAPLEI